MSRGSGGSIQLIAVGNPLLDPACAMSNEMYTERSPDHSLRQARLDAGLSQQELAAAADLAVSTISRLERGHMAPARKTRRKLALALDCGSELLFSSRLDAPSGGGVVSPPEKC